MLSINAPIDTVRHRRTQAQDSTSATYNTEDAYPLVIVGRMSFWLQYPYFSPIETVVAPIHVALAVYCKNY